MTVFIDKQTIISHDIHLNIFEHFFENIFVKRYTEYRIWLNNMNIKKIKHGGNKLDFILHLQTPSHVK